MKKYSVFILMLLVVFTGCYDEPDLLSDLTTTEGKHFPVIASFGTESGETTFSSGASVGLDLRYWSVDEIDQIIFSETIDGNTSEFANLGYTQNFAEDSQTDKLVVDYTAPSVAAETTVTITVEILNANGLNKTGSVSLTIVP